MTTDWSGSDGFHRLLQRANNGNRQAEAALTILNQEWARTKARLFVDCEGIDFAGMLSEHTAEDAGDGTCETWRAEPYGCDCGPYWSSGEALLIRLAWNLWSGDARSAVDVARLLDICGDNSLALVFTAIEARNGGQLPTGDESRPRTRTTADGNRTRDWGAASLPPAGSAQTTSSIRPLPPRHPEV